MGYEYVSLDGLRLDGRRPEEVRKIQCSLGEMLRADGSAHYEQGNTKILATVFGPRELTSRSRGLHDRALINCDVSILAFASSRADERTRTSSKGDRRSKEISSMIERVFESAILTHMFAKSQIDISVQVLQSDGSVASAAVNAVSLALVNAGVPMSDFVCGCNVGVLQGEFVVDMNAVESGSDGPQLSIAMMISSGKVTSFELESRMSSVDVFEEAMACASDGCRQVYHVLQHEIKIYTLGLIDSRGLVAL